MDANYPTATQVPSPSRSKPSGVCQETDSSENVHPEASQDRVVDQDTDTVEIVRYEASQSVGRNTECFAIVPNKALLGRPEIIHCAASQVVSHEPVSVENVNPSGSREFYSKLGDIAFYHWENEDGRIRIKLPLLSSKGEKAGRFERIYPSSTHLDLDAMVFYHWDSENSKCELTLREAWVIQGMHDEQSGKSIQET
ncbi:MAG: hypothetical protein Q9159_000395 [Coniocarpon cinnabarinum]